MELWEYNFKKAENNLISSRILFQKGFVSLAAFHAQQCVELGVKAVALKHGFELYLRKNPKFKHSHIPARSLTSEIYDFVIESLEATDTTQFDEKMNESITDAMKAVKAIVEILKEIEEHKNGKKFEEVWKYSLGLESSEEIITALDSYKKSCDTKLSKELCSGVSKLSRKSILELENFTRKNRQGFKFRMAVKRIKEIVQDYGLSEKIVDALLASEEEFEKTINDLVEKHGIVGTMDFLLSPNGFLNVFDDPRLPSKILKKWNAKKRINFIWITYLVTMSPTTVLLFPHAIIGRYPRRMIDSNMNSEDIYLEHSPKVEVLIDESDRTLKRIKQILEI